MQLVYLLIFIHLIPRLATAQLQNQTQCKESRCSPNGPLVRFPFRLLGRQPESCGFPGFNLSCSDDNQTIMTLPVSVNLIVVNIKYLDQSVELRDPENCIEKHAQALNFSSSIFSPGSQTFAFFNCSSSVDITRDYAITCLSGAGYTVLAVPSYIELTNVNLLSCVKLYDVHSTPYSTFNTQKIFYWSKPYCQECEREGRICGPSFTSNHTSVQCFAPPPPPLKKGQEALKAPVVAGIVGGVVFVLLVLTTAVVCYLKGHSKSKNDEEIEKFLEHYKGQMPTRYTYSEIKRCTNHFEHKLGQGGYGSVYKGKLTNGNIVAVKILENPKGVGDDFVNEVTTMGNIHHVNVVRLVGFCADGIHQALVFEFLPNESLDKYISITDSSERFPLLSWIKLHEIAIGIAKGIEYLHQGCDKRILHFDIKPHNILLDQNYIPKLCDFGQAKLCAKDQSVVSMTAARGTMGYIAPEVFSRDFGSVSSKSDVYSFGMLLIEMVGSKMTKAASLPANATQAYVPEMIYNCLKRGDDMGVKIEVEADNKIVKKLAKVGLWCIQWLPDDRPSMKIVIQMLEADGDNLHMPQDPFASINRMKGISSLQTTKFGGNDLEVIDEGS